MDGTPVEEAYNYIDWSNTLYSGVETMHSSWVSTSTMACLRTALKEMGNEEYDYRFVSYDCLSTLVINLIVKGAIDQGDKFAVSIAKSLRNKPRITIESLKKLKVDKGMVEWIIGKVLKEGLSNYDKIIEEVYE